MQGEQKRMRVVSGIQPTGGLHLGNLLGGKLQLAAKVNTSLLSLGDAIHLTLAPNVVLELSYQRQDTHHQLAGAAGGVDRRVIHHSKGHAFIGQLRDDAAEIRG